MMVQKEHLLVVQQLLVMVVMVTVRSRELAVAVVVLMAVQSEELAEVVVAIVAQSLLKQLASSMAALEPKVVKLLISFCQ